MRLVRFGEDGAVLRRSDFPSLQYGVPVFGPRAMHALGATAFGYGQFLSLRGVDCSILNVTNNLEALDKERSRIVYFDDGHILQIEQYFFRPEVIEGHQIFRLPWRGAEVFVSEAFVQRVHAASLTGAEFETVWEQDGSGDPVI